MLQNLSHNIYYHYYFLPPCYKCYIMLQDLSQIFIITIIFFRHVTNVTNVTSHYKISPILACRAPLDAITETTIENSDNLAFVISDGSTKIRIIEIAFRGTIKFELEDPFRRRLSVIQAVHSHLGISRGRWGIWGCEI